MSHPSSVLIAQITDTHLFAEADQQLLGVQTLASLQSVLRQLECLPHRPDLLLLTGDLSQDNSPESYHLLETLIAPLQIPTYWTPGNHDCPATMARILTRSPFSANKSFHIGGWHLLLLDSCVPGCVHGYLSPESLDWLDHQLDQSGSEPALIAFHHPPFLIGSDWMNDIGLLNAADFFEVCDRHPQIKLVLFGHIHQEFNLQRQGVLYLGTPSTCIQFKPNSAQFCLDEDYPGLRLIHLHPNGTWETRVERIACACKIDLAATGY
jgi:Icc protein